MDQANPVKSTTLPPVIARKFLVLRTEDPESSATLQGVVNRALILTALSLLSALGFWEIVRHSIVDREIQYGLGWWAFVAPLASYVLMQILFHRPRRAWVLAPAIAVLMGIFCGTLAGVAEMGSKGVVIQALLVTFGTFIGLLVSYKFRWVQVNDRFLSAVLRYVFALLSVATLNVILPMLVPSWKNSLHSYTALSMILSFSFFVAGGAALLVSFSEVEELIAGKKPRYLEWYGGFAVYASLVWMFVALLFVFARLRRRR